MHLEHNISKQGNFRRIITDKALKHGKSLNRHKIEKILEGCNSKMTKKDYENYILK